MNGWRFNTLFLLQATAVTALCCLPMALLAETGFVWTAFLLPISLALLASTQVENHGCNDVLFRELPNSAVEIYSLGNRYDQWYWQCRVWTAGGLLSCVAGFPTLHLVDPEPIEFWLPLVVLFEIGAMLLIGHGARRTVLIEERQLVTDHLLFGRLRLWRRRWHVRKGDFLAAFAIDQGTAAPFPEMQYYHKLYVCRPRREHAGSRRRQLIAQMFTSDRIAPGMERAAQHVAKLVDAPFAGYRESKVLVGRSATGATFRQSILQSAATE